MIGLIQKVLLDLVQAKGGEIAVQKVRQKAQVPAERIFRIGEVYSDAEWNRLLNSTQEVFNLSEDQVMEAYSQAFFKDMTTRFGKWFDMAKNSKVLLEYQTKIHNTFASSLKTASAQKAVNDKFSIQLLDDRNIITHYKSPNKLCKLYIALGRRVAEYYGDEVSFSQSHCMNLGDDECKIHVTWSKFKVEV